MKKLNWLKINWYDENAIICVSKHSVRDYVKGKGLGHILVKQIAIFENEKEINSNNISNNCVLKTTHDSGGVYLITDKEKVDLKTIKKDIKKRLKINYALLSGEWPYHYVSRKIVCEELLVPKKNKEILDYKVLCFNGKPELIYVTSLHGEEKLSAYYDLNWNKLSIKWNNLSNDINLKKPLFFNKMIEYSKILSSDFPHARIDFFDVDDEIYFSEITFFHYAGFGLFDPDKIDLELGKLLKLPNKENSWNKK